MIIYQSDVHTFISDVMSLQIVDKLEHSFFRTIGHSVSNSEKDSWRNSLAEMCKVLFVGQFPQDAGIALEYNVPQTPKRVDFMISGYGEQDEPAVVVVELKQWSTSEVSDIDGVVLACRGGHRGPVAGAHPSYQAWSYTKMLESFNDFVYQSKLKLKPCAYLHNHDTHQAAVRDPRYCYYLKLAPCFLKGTKEQQDLIAFIRRFIKKGDGARLIEQMDNGKLRPSKSLSDVVGKILDGNEEFVLIDEQKLVAETIYAAAKSVYQEGEKDSKTPKQVFIVRGGPGTGKSVIAINLLSRFIGDRMMAAYVSKNAAPRAVYLEQMKGGSKTQVYLKGLFQSSGAFIDVKNVFDVLLADEAHRLNEKSGMYGINGENQILEIIKSAQTTVFFVDENQRVTIKDIGTEEEIRKQAKRCKAKVIDLDLYSQFRCAGSTDYLNWLTQTLGISQSDTYQGPVAFDFKVFHSATQMHQAIIEKNQQGLKARVVAGYCWSWESKKDPNADDIVLDEGTYRKQWNLAQDGSLWALNGSVETIGCIHTCQGLEFDYVGVIIGADLFVRDDVVCTDAARRARTDQSLKGWKTMSKTEPERTHQLTDELIKNTYRTLMSRGMKGCYVYCEDAETREYFTARWKALQRG